MSAENRPEWLQGAFAVQREVVTGAARHAAAGVIVGAILLPVVSTLILANMRGIDGRSGLQTLVLSVIVFGAATCAGLERAARASRIAPAITLRSE
jgi:Ca2+/Na+ antiporter